VFVDARREGREAVISLEVDPASKTPIDSSELEARITDPSGRVCEVPLERVAEGKFEGRLALDRDGIALGNVAVGASRSVSVPPIALPYSPEFERGSDPAVPERLMQRVARESGGEAIASAAELWRGPRDAASWRLVVRECLLLALALWLVEIAARRLELFAALRISKTLRTWRIRERWTREVKRGLVEPPFAPQVSPARDAPIEAKPAARPSAPAAPERSATSEALERARRAAHRRRGT
jgi:hypothetical protein